MAIVELHAKHRSCGGGAVASATRSTTPNTTTNFKLFAGNFRSVLPQVLLNPGIFGKKENPTVAKTKASRVFDSIPSRKESRLQEINTAVRRLRKKDIRIRTCE